MITSLRSGSVQPSTRLEKARWKTALGWWVVAGAIGIVLRYQLVFPSEKLVYPYLLHAHSHVVLLGWAFSSLFLALLAAFIGPAASAFYRWLWLLFQVGVLGMLVFFPVQGYAAGSIVFSTLHVFASYALCWRLWKDTREDRTLSAALLRWGLFFLLFSTLGPYALGILKARQLQDTVWYNLSVYFYLHFLYNGWFLFGCLALLLRWLEDWHLAPSASAGRILLVSLVLSAFGTAALSALWTNPPGWVWAVGGLSAVVQAGAGGWLLLGLWRRGWSIRGQLRPQAYPLVRLAALSLGLKLALQTASALPWASRWAYEQRHLVIAYLHLVFIGVISFFLLAWAIHHGRLRWSGRAGNFLILTFVLTEAALVIESVLQKEGSFVPHFGPLMLLLSIGLWWSVLALWRGARSGHG